MVCRIRPVDEKYIAPDKQHRVPVKVNMEDSRLVTTDPRNQRQRSFLVDGIVLPQQTQQDMYGVVQPMIVSALDGYNVCISAYGQTGSGKSMSRIIYADPDWSNSNSAHHVW